MHNTVSYPIRHSNRCTVEMGHETDWYSIPGFHWRPVAGLGQSMIGWLYSGLSYVEYRMWDVSLRLGWIQMVGWVSRWLRQWSSRPPPVQGVAKCSCRNGSSIITIAGIYVLSLYQRAISVWFVEIDIETAVEFEGRECEMAGTCTVAARSDPQRSVREGGI